NFPEKELANKKAKFVCKILNVKNPEDVKIDDGFAKNLGAKDLNDLKTLISKQINDEYKNSLDQLSKNQILKEIEKIKVDEVPENLIEEEVKILSQGMDDADAKKNKAKFTKTAITRIKTGLILNQFGEQNKIQVSEQEIQAEVQKQLRMMPGQEKMVMDFYQKNPSAVASLRGTVYEEKILNLIKEKAKPNKKEISKDEAEKILKEAHNHDHDHNHGKEKKNNETKKKVETKSDIKKKPSTKTSKSKPVAKKVSKK
ncbi:trigger factor, partial [Candidatus Pelagibacter sp.]|nr:trigger factor [Candidatus Pelagibacter sp.]